MFRCRKNFRNWMTVSFLFFFREYFASRKKSFSLSLLFQWQIAKTSVFQFHYWVYKYSQSEIPVARTNSLLFSFSTKQRLLYETNAVHSTFRRLLKINVDAFELFRECIFICSETLCNFAAFLTTFYRLSRKCRPVECLSRLQRANHARKRSANSFIDHHLQRSRLRACIPCGITHYVHRSASLVSFEMQFLSFYC